MPHVKDHRARTTEKGIYATAEDFEQPFAKQNTDLFRLSLHLTADAEKAESCVILAMRDSFSGAAFQRIECTPGRAGW